MEIKSKMSHPLLLDMFKPKKKQLFSPKAAKKKLSKWFPNIRYIIIYSWKFIFEDVGEAEG